MPDFYQVTSSSYLQQAGQPFTVTVTAFDGVTVNCWEDDHQDPVLVTFYDPLLFVPDDDQWDEFHYSNAALPGSLCRPDREPAGDEVLRCGAQRVISHVCQPVPLKTISDTSSGSMRVPHGQIPWMWPAARWVTSPSSTWGRCR